MAFSKNPQTPRPPLAGADGSSLVLHPIHLQPAQAQQVLAAAAAAAAAGGDFAHQSHSDVSMAQLAQVGPGGYSRGLVSPQDPCGPVSPDPGTCFDGPAGPGGSRGLEDLVFIPPMSNPVVAPQTLLLVAPPVAPRGLVRGLIRVRPIRPRLWPPRHPGHDPGSRA
jgi:hypothetical protein